MGKLSKQVEAQSSGGFNRNAQDSPMDDEVEREFEDEWEVFDEGGV